MTWPAGSGPCSDAAAVPAARPSHPSCETSSCAWRASGARESELGLSAHSGRAPQAGARRRRDDRPDRAAPAPGAPGPAPRGAGLLACDFFCVETVLLQTLYALFFLEVQSRRVVVAGCTADPTAAWVTQQARNVCWELAAAGWRPTVLLRDRDAKFAPAFDADFAAEGVRVVRTPVRAPRANAFAERWVGTVRRECLDWSLILDARHLQRVLREYAEHYNRARPHRARGLHPPLGPPPPRPGISGPVRRRDCLGGLLHEYERVAA